MPEDFYDLLEVPEDASPEEIKGAFRAKAREHHPDVSDEEEATAKFQVVQKAYDVLSDPEERETYDRLGHRTYVADRLGGLPGIDSPESSSGGTDAGGDRSRPSGAARSRSATRTARSGSTARTSTGRATRGGDQTVNEDGGTTTATGGGWQYYRTAPERGSVPDRSTSLAVLGALACYSFGVWRFVEANRAGMNSFVGAMAEAGTGGAIRVLGSTGYGIEHPLGFAMAGLAEESMDALFPIGAILLGVAVAVAAWQFDRDEAALVAVAAAGPLAELAVEYAATAGTTVPPPLLDAVGVTLVLLLALPAGAVVGLGALFYDARV